MRVADGAVRIVFFFAVAASAAAAASSSSCSQAKRLQFTCPNCGGFPVEDCHGACDGFSYADTMHTICIRRVLCPKFNDDITDYENHYHYFWVDFVGMFVWFLTAAVSIAAGVGGGGIYVPLGILLLQFAYVSVFFRGYIIYYIADNILVFLYIHDYIV
jgi:hypothetical protein